LEQSKAVANYRIESKKIRHDKEFLPRNKCVEGLALLVYGCTGTKAEARPKAKTKADIESAEVFIVS